MNKTLIGYIGHGINSKQFFPQTTEVELAHIAETKKKIFGTDDIKFVVLYNNRNIRRKMPGDVVVAYREFVLSLPEKDRSKCRLLMHTQPVDENGTDLISLIKDIGHGIHVAFSADRLDTPMMNTLYNIADVTINIANAEGFGISTAESLMAGTMVLATVTGGLQDQAGFVDEHDNYLDSDAHFNQDWGSNHDGKYQTCGDWFIPVYPKTRTVIGSPATPYIYEDHADWAEVGEKIRMIYDMSSEERERRGALGREYMIHEGFDSKTMCNKFIKGIEEVFEQWTPRDRFVLVKG